MQANAAIATAACNALPVLIFSKVQSYQDSARVATASADCDSGPPRPEVHARQVARPELPMVTPAPALDGRVVLGRVKAKVSKSVPAGEVRGIGTHDEERGHGVKVRNQETRVVSGQALLAQQSFESDSPRVQRVCLLCCIVARSAIVGADAEAQGGA